MKSRPWVKLLAVLFPTARCAACQQQATTDPFATNGVALVGARTAAEVDSAHTLQIGSVRYAYVPCGEARYVGYYGTTPDLHHIGVRARAEWTAATLRVRVSAPDGAANTDRALAVTVTTTEGQGFEVPVTPRPGLRAGMWIIELRAEGACQGIRLNLSLPTAPMFGP